MGHEDHKHNAISGVRCAVLTVSDTRTIETDTSGRAIVEILREVGHAPVHSGLVPDDLATIKDRLLQLLGDGSLQAVVVNGGTGVGRRDVTIEAVAPLLEMELVGFGELFRALSYREIGSAAMMSRAIGGISHGKPVFCIPGSEKACRLAVRELIGPELGHLLWEVSR
jgi:molybdenum cofactor biosynthesis protein B